MVVKLEGIVSPLPTPFKSNYELDEEALRELVGFVVDGGVYGLLVNGSTGEFITMSAEERQRTVEIVSEECKRKVFIIAGAEMPVTHASIAEAKRVKQAGADFLLLGTPFYVNPTTDGMYEHFKKVAEAGVPALLYNNPWRTHIVLSTQLIIRLAEEKNIAGIKQSNPDMNQTAEIIQATAGGKFAFIHSYGDAVSIFPGLLLGGAGAMSLATLFVPEKVMQLYEATIRKDVETAKKIWVEIHPLLTMGWTGVHGEPNPAPVKEALRLVGRPVGPTRLPVIPVTEDTTKKLEKILRNQKLC